MKMRTFSRWIGLILWPVLASAQYVADRYIVELSSPPAVEAAVREKGQRAARTAELPQRRAEVRARQRALRPGIEQAGATVLESVDTIANAMIVRTSAERAAQLGRLSGVARVHRVREFRLLLDRAAVLHQVDRAWSQIGQERAGLGVKIAIIDSGIDADHPGFQDATLPALDGYPKVNQSSDLAFTNRKVIVARSYAPLFARRDPDESARDRVGHGTALAMAAAGMPHAAPLATIAGVAPRAYLGSYKVFGTPGFNETASEDAILKAFDDAVADGMDVINLSFGTSLAPRVEDDIEVQAIERATALGVIVVAAVGNSGPDPFSISSPATAPSALSVGASHNSRVFSTTAAVGDSTYLSIAGNGTVLVQQITAPLADVATWDAQGLACSPLSPGSLTGYVALILRGVCTFEEKLNNARAAGAAAGLVYTDAERPEPVAMSVGSAILPAQMVSYADGLQIKANLQSAAEAALPATLRFTLEAVSADPYRLASFSARGPNVDRSIKPDLLAAGTDIYTATQRFDESGEMFAPDGYISADGTSFSAPLVAGAVALLKAARPGLTPEQYRSLLVNGAAPLKADSVSPVQHGGAGMFDLNGALNATATSSPAALSFGVAGQSPRVSQILTLRDLTGRDENYYAAVVPRISSAPGPELSSEMIRIAAGSTADISVQFADPGLSPGTYDGFLVLQGLTAGSVLRIPYWYAVPGPPERISVLQVRSSGRAGAAVETAVLFRVLDSSGVPLTQVEPTVSLEGGGSVLGVAVREDLLPGALSIDLRLASQPGVNVVRIQAGDVSSEVSIRGR
jgi:subtilisin family serine protease